MYDARDLLKRQEEWQKLRATMTWAEKVRMAEAVREDVARLARSRHAGTTMSPPINKKEGGSPEEQGQEK